MHRRSVEICVGDLTSARAAAEGGADRVELCADLPSGGVTPSFGLVAEVVDRVGIAAHVLIRPRAGDFVAGPDELAVMLRDIDAARAADATGVVIGVLLADGWVDEATTARLIDRAGPLSVTFHRAIDLTPDPLAALETLIRLGVSRVLTSGGPGPARGNLAGLKALADRAGDRVIIMAGGGIAESDLPGLLVATGVHEVHLGWKVTGEAPPPGPFGRGPAPVEADRVRRVVRLVRGESST